jgi:diaminopimelate epimerase
MRLAFTKMHGAGNDFVVLDRRDAVEPLSDALIRLLGDRHRGVGCDQLLTIEPPRSPGAVLAYGIWNGDGSRAGQCGNGARCVAAWARRAGLLEGGGPWLFDSPSGVVTVRDRGVDGFEIDMGVPRFDAAAVGFVDDGRGQRLVMDSLTWAFDIVSMGNPHAVLLVDDLDHAPVAALGAALQGDGRFADGVNVGVAQRVSPRGLRLRVVERGAGETLACGSAACAAVAALRQRGMLEASVAVRLPGGTLSIDWPGEGKSLRMCGPAAFVFEGVLNA